MTMNKYYIALGGISARILSKSVDNLMLHGNNLFAYIDADRLDIQDIKNENITKLCFFRPCSNEEILRIYPEFKEWMTESRFALESFGYYYRIMARLYFETYLKKHILFDSLNFNKITEGIDINIITSSFGNTGSGILLNVILLIHKYMRENNIKKYNINLMMILPEFMNGAINSNTQKHYNNANCYATIKELYSFNEMYNGRKPTRRIVISELFDSDCANDITPHLFNNIFFYSQKDDNDHSVLDNMDDIVKKIYEYDKANDSSVFNNAYKSLSDIALPYKSAYDDEKRKLDDLEKYVITPHIDKNWHNILFDIEY